MASLNQRGVNWMDENFYNGFRHRWDDYLLRERILASLQPEHRVLDFGAGRGNIEQMNFKDSAAFVAGVDVDPVVKTNPHVHEARVIDLADGKIPYPDNSFDVVFADNVVEHIAKPDVAFAEWARVLKPGGKFLAKTPNRWHYVAMIASLTPTWFHTMYNNWRGRRSDDTFPTVYASNSPSAVRMFALRQGLAVHDIELIEGRPEYLRLTVLTYVAGFIYERLVNSIGLLKPFRCVLIFELVKPEN